MKRILSVLMCVMMIVAMMPGMAMAEGTVTPTLPDGVTAESFGDNTVTDGTNYYATLQAAVEGVCGTANAVLYCKPGADVGQMTHGSVKANLTVYGNGACTSGNGDFDIGNTDPSGGMDINTDITLTVYNLNGCGAWGTKATEHTVNIVFENCKDMSEVYLHGAVGTVNITMTDCEFTDNVDGGNCKVYSNANGNITLTRVLFSGVDKAVNLNHKAVGTQTVTITDCTFTNCGNDVAADQIPVRVLSSEEGGKSVLTVEGCTFTGTAEGGADILLDYGVGTTSATISNTAANILQETESNVGEIESIDATEIYSKTIQSGEEPVALPEVEITDITDSLPEDVDLTFALNFAIKDIENVMKDEVYLEKLFAKYGSYYTDYVLTISGLTADSVIFNANGNADGYLAGQYDAWSENWVSVPFENVTVENGKSLYIMEYAASLMGQSGLRFTLAEIAEIVQNFDCGVYFKPEFLEANPDMKVTLELKVFTEDAEGNKIDDISVATNEFEAKKTFVASVTDSESDVTKYYATFERAVAAADNDTITLLKDVGTSEVIQIGKNVVINGDGHSITSPASRIIRVTAGGVGVVINDLDMISTAVRVGTNDIRGISIDNVTGVSLVLNNCTVGFTDASADDWAYGVNVTGGSGHMLNIVGGTYEGANAININGDTHTVIIDGANLTSLYKESESYCGVCVRLTGNGSEVDVKNTTFNGNWAVSIEDKANNTVTTSNNTNNTACNGAHGNLKSVAKVEATYSAAGMKAHFACNECGTLFADAERTTKVSASSLVIPKLEPVYVPDPTPVAPTPSTPKEDVVTNTTTNTDTAGTTVVAPTTNADVSASTTTTKTETGEAKTETKVEQTVADKIVEKAVENKSEEVVIDTTTKAPTTGTTTTAPAEETKAAEVVIPTETIEKIATQTEAAVTIKTDVAEIKLDNTAAAAIAEQAAEEGTISIVAVKTDEVVVEETTAAGETKAVTEVHFELKVVCSERGVIGDFKGGEVTVTVPVPKNMQTEELVCVYIDAQGHYHRVTGVKNANGTFSFTTDHFSSYAVMTAEEAEKAIAEQKAKVESAKLKLRSANAKTSKGKKAIKLTVSEVTDTGIDFDGYVIYRSTKKTSGFKKIYTTKTGTYYNTAVKAGTKYYYKAKGFVTIDGEKVYTGWSLKAIRTAK